MNQEYQRQRLDRFKHEVQNLSTPISYEPQVLLRAGVYSSAEAVMCGWAMRRYEREGYLMLENLDPTVPLKDQVLIIPGDGKRPSNCKNCGAPLAGVECGYCRTRYL